MCQPCVSRPFVPALSLPTWQPDISDTWKQQWTGHVGCPIMPPSNKQTSGCNGYLPWFVQTGTQTCTCRVSPHPLLSHQEAPDGRQKREWKYKCDPELQPSVKPLNTWKRGFLWRVRQQSRASRYPLELNVQYDHTLCIANQINV